MHFFFIFITIFFNSYAQYFVGIGYANLNNNYRYSELLVKQYIKDISINGTDYKLPINQYIDVNIPRRSSFGMSSNFSNSAIVFNLGKKFTLKKKFFYSSEAFVNYTKAKTRDEIVVIPEVNLGNNFVGNILNQDLINSSKITNVVESQLKPIPIFGNSISSVVINLINNQLCPESGSACSVTQENIETIKPIIESALCSNGECKIPSKITPITYSMPFNAGLISRIGYEFTNFDFNFITGATLTIFDIKNGNISERVYKGRFIAGFGFEMPIGKKDNSKLYLDYKYYIPLSKNIVREYQDSVNKGKASRVEIKDFGAETQLFEIGFKYYFD